MHYSITAFFITGITLFFKNYSVIHYWKLRLLHSTPSIRSNWFLFKKKKEGLTGLPWSVYYKHICSSYLWQIEPNKATNKITICCLKKPKTQQQELCICKSTNWKRGIVCERIQKARSKSQLNLILTWTFEADHERAEASLLVKWWDSLVPLRGFQPQVQHQKQNVHQFFCFRPPFEGLVLLQVNHWRIQSGQS